MSGGPDHDDAHDCHNEGFPPRHALREGGLTLVATPIGNLGDFSPRAQAALREADLVLCEDTRVTARLLQHYGISVRTGALHDHNEEQRLPGLVQQLREGVRIALVSDAGMPVMSDPGYRLVRAVTEAGLPLTAVPGPNAALTALVLSGLPPHPFMFLGFPPPREAARLESFRTLRAAELAGLHATLIWHEAPHRVADMVADLADVFGTGRQVVIARELTKRFEELLRGDGVSLAKRCREDPPRGEMTVLIAPPAAEEEDGAADLDERLVAALEHSSVRDAAAIVAKASGLPRRTVYARALELAALRGA
ncbi:16S rRNA (cytidine(1402)-2'-O)-methyltransferase [Acetobacter sp. AN02]|uniref:16S rRNA (cytidine(1402)-2'-O)-methyltransferase n=1 Tax=Acetobacter sp. AN02 TaxID=2894186 RepID=UPI002434169A|nr:16S rRNA (cytidine(1402)-2'-O)-methyltransferase [Acetobacter sp. AN02]MDG6095495.1 16S rRNA (cytidine(1402)-2'-O)-methyltransferase [Acetobacter sp. AN02]